MASIRLDRAGAWGETLGILPRYQPLVERMERQAETGSRSHARRVLAAGLLGYVFIGAILVLLIGTGIAIVMTLMSGGSRGGAALIKLLIVVGLAAFGVIRALNLPKLPVDGVRLERADAPRLFDFLDTLERETGGPRLDEVILNDELNAAVSQQPRFGPFGNVSRLYLGLDLLHALPPREVQAVIAHEFGHFAGDHGRSASFVYRVRMRWFRLSQELPDGIVAAGLRKFFNWYSPWFAAYSFTLARRQEYEADAVAARLVGPSEVANALKRLDMQGARAGFRWAEVWNGAPLGEPMPESASSLSARHFLEPGDTACEDVARKALEASLAEHPGLDDTHPTLTQRLAALGEPATPPPPYERSGARDLIAPAALVRLEAEFDARWRERCGENWLAQKDIREALLDEMEALEAKGVDALSKTQHRRLAELTGEIRGDEARAQAYSGVVTRFPDDPIVCMEAGLALAATDDRAAVVLFEHAAELDHEMGPNALAMALDLLERLGDEAGSERVGAKVDLAAQRAADAQDESARLDGKCDFRAIDPELREEILEWIGDVAGLERVRVAHRMRSFSVSPQLVVLFKCRKGYDGMQMAAFLVDALERFGDVVAIEEAFAHGWLARRLKKLEGALLIG
ncbi:M48 family metallopeptidase [Sphingomicrobium nitratireducens]|uniref:M48 family metallopeptidase n=1 Tax=Sphingomicrobium nitratireducens TaxID=2964666 RepID=UPI00223EA18A|nr:M48 family metallopeptidase [Sphingomicrobium nitratireducens]